MQILIAIALWILFFITLEQTIICAIKKAHRELAQEHNKEAEPKNK